MIHILIGTEEEMRRWTRREHKKAGKVQRYFAVGIPGTEIAVRVFLDEQEPEKKLDGIINGLEEPRGERAKP